MVKLVNIKNDKGGFSWNSYTEVEDFIFRDNMVVIRYKNGNIEYTDLSNVLCKEKGD